MASTRGLAVVAVAAAAVVAVGALAWVSSGAGLPGTVASPGAAASTPLPSGSATADADPTAAGRRFLADWVTDGRVIRRDQGGDTGSEGQAYGMLIALGLGDEKSFDAIWSWTKAHLQRDDGLLAWRWQSGKVVDDEPAADADLDAARALVLAGTRFHRPELTTAGDRLGAEHPSANGAYYPSLGVPTNP